MLKHGFEGIGAGSRWAVMGARVTCCFNGHRLLIRVPPFQDQPIK